MTKTTTIICDACEKNLPINLLYCWTVSHQLFENDNFEIHFCSLDHMMEHLNKYFDKKDRLPHE